MADRQLKVTLIGDARQLNRTLGVTETRLATFGKTATKTSGLFGKLNTSALFAGAAGGAGFFAATAAAEVLTSALRKGISAAASLQKSGEAIDATFGSSAKGVKQFANDAASLGISAVQSEALSARVGILARNLGIAAPQAAAMSVGLQKVAGSIAEIRGVSPESLLAGIPLVLAGNIRALKQWGFAFTQAEIAQEAVRIGAIQQGQALTSSAKAQAVYALTTKNLGSLQQIAASHSGDLTNQQHKLGAEVSNLEANLGSLITGPLTRFVGLLVNVTGKVNTFTSVVSNLAKAEIPGLGTSFDHLAGQFLHFSKFVALPEIFGTQAILGKLGIGGGKAKTPTAAQESAAASLFQRIGGLPALPANKKPGQFASQKDFLAALQAAGFTAANAVPGGELLTGTKAPTTPKWLETFRKQLDRLQLGTGRAGLTKTLTDDIAAEKRIVGYVDQQAKLHSKNLEVLNAQVQAQSDLLSLQQQQRDALKQAGQTILSTVVNKLQALLSKRQADRQLEDARKALQTARIIGGPQGIKLASRDVQDALLQRQLAAAEQASIRVAKGGTFTVTIGSVQLYGIQNARQLLAELQKLSRTSSAPSRGVTPGAALLPHA